jgi:WD40 repeat protein
VLGLVADGVVARCVLVVRGDHVGRLAEHAATAEQIVGALELVPPLTESQLREVLERSAADVGLRIEPELVDVVVQDVVGRGGALPLLSMAMVGTWERRRGDVLTLGGYLAAGGVAGAVARTAEDVYASFDTEAQQLAHQVLVRLADHDEDGALQRRRMPLDEVDLDGPEGRTRRSVVEALVRHRLLTMDSCYLEVAHEALLTAWPRLARWLDDDAVGRAVRRHLAPAAQDWERHARPADELYRGARLDAAVQWAAAPASDLTAVERSFLDAGVAAAQAELSEAHRRADAEAAARTRLRRLAVALATALALALVATGIALVYQRTARDRATDAETAGRVADASRLAALSTTARSLDLSLLLAAAAMRTASTRATEDGLLTALVSHRRATGVFSVGDNVYETSLSPDSRTLFTTHAGGEPTVTSWRTGSAGLERTIGSGWPDHIAAAPDGKLVVTASDRTGSNDIVAFSRRGRTVGAVRRAQALGGRPQDVVFTRDGRLLAVVVNQEVAGRTPWRAYLTRVDLRHGTHGALRPVSRSPGPDVPLESSFSEDGSSLVVWAKDGSRATRMDLRMGTTVPLAIGRRDAASLGFMALPGGAVQRWSDGALTRYDAGGAAAQVLSFHEAPVRDVAVVPGGGMAVSVGEEGQVELWRISPVTGDWASREPLIGHVGNVQQAEVTRDGRTLLTISEDGVLVRWDLSGSAGFGATYPGMGGRWISSPIRVVDPGKLVVAAARGVRRTLSVAAVFLDPRSGRVVDRVVVGNTLPDLVFGSSVAVNPDARLVAVTSGTATTVLDARTRDVVRRIVLRAPTPGEGPIQVWSASWTPDGRRLLLGSEGSETETSWHLVTVDTATWRPVGRVELPAAAEVMEWSPDRSRLAVGLEATAAVAVLDAHLRLLRTVYLPNGGEPFDLAFSPDGRRLAVGGHNGRVSVLDTSTWLPVHAAARVHSGPVVDVEWLPDGNTVVTGGVDDVASLYDVDRDLVRAASLPASDDPGAGYAFLMPGPTDEVVVLNGQTPGHRYPLAPSNWLAAACAIAGRDLTVAEWSRYVPTRPYRATCSDLLPS